MRDLIKHLKNIAKWWWALIAAAWSAFWIADSIIGKWGSPKVKGWWDTYTQHFPSNWETWLIGLLVIALALIIWGSYQHSKANTNAAKAEIKTLNELAASLKKELEYFHKPRFSGYFKNRAIAPFPASMKEDERTSGATAVAHAELELLNSGTPSVAIDWQCELHCSGKLVRTLMYYPNGSINLDTTPPTTLTRRDFLGEKTIQPIATGARVIGWLGVIIFGVTRDEARDGIWKFYCYDSARQKHTFEFPNDESTPGPGFTYQLGR